MTKEELLKSRERKILLPEYDPDEKNRFFNGVDLNNNKNTDFVYGDIKVNVGQFFLYEATIDDYLHYPKLALFLKYGFVDMAVDVYYLDVERSWEWRLEYEMEYNDNGELKKYKISPAEEEGVETKNLILWDDSMDVYGVWDKMPTWKELRVAYQKTIWFSKSKEDKRDQFLRTIL